MDSAEAGANGNLSDGASSRISIKAPAFAKNAKGRATRPSSQNGSNWGIYQLRTGGGSTPLLDQLSGPGTNNNPPPSPTPKCDHPPTGATTYELAPQAIRVGSDTSGTGVEVQTDNLTYYIDNGAHTSIVVPPPPPK